MKDAHKLSESTCRIERVIWLPGATVDADALSPDFEEFVENDMPEDESADLGQQLPEMMTFILSDDTAEPWEVAEALQCQVGFLVQAATPVLNYYKDGGFTYSWGHYHTAWIYCDTADQIADIVCGWANKRHDADKARARP